MTYDLKNKDNLKNENDLKNEDNLKNADNLKNKNVLKMKKDSKIKIWQKKSLKYMNLSIAENRLYKPLKFDEIFSVLGDLCRGHSSPLSSHS